MQQLRTLYLHVRHVPYCLVRPRPIEMDGALRFDSASKDLVLTAISPLPVPTSWTTTTPDPIPVALLQSRQNPPIDDLTAKPSTLSPATMPPSVTPSCFRQGQHWSRSRCFPLTTPEHVVRCSCRCRRQRETLVHASARRGDLPPLNTPVRAGALCEEL